jgi:hypothetical protein
MIEARNVPEQPLDLREALRGSLALICQVDDEDRAIMPSAWRRQYSTHPSRTEVFVVPGGVLVNIELIDWVRLYIAKVAGLQVQAGHLNRIANARACNNI